MLSWLKKLFTRKPKPRYSITRQEELNIRLVRENLKQDNEKGEKMSDGKQKLIAGPIEGYKATDDKIQCKGFQYEIGKEYVLPDDKELVLCEHGFHFCQQPSGPWTFYSTGRLFKVLAWDVLDVPFEPGADFKRVCRKIKFVSEIKVSGYGDTGNRNTGDRNTGDWNTGNGNTGDRNTCDGNTGDGNTGYWNTGDGNTGDGNACNFSSGFFCIKEPPVVFFDRPTNIEIDKIDMSLVRELCDVLKNKKLKDFELEKFLSLPNATIERIRALHKKQITLREKAKK